MVKEKDEIVVEKIEANAGRLEIEKLAEFEDEKMTLQLGTPVLQEKVAAEIVDQLKGDKIRVAKFHAKVRYRKVMGFRKKLTKIKVIKI